MSPNNSEKTGPLKEGISLRKVTCPRSDRTGVEPMVLLDTKLFLLALTEPSIMCYLPGAQ